MSLTGNYAADALIWMVLLAAIGRGVGMLINLHPRMRRGGRPQ